MSNEELVDNVVSMFVVEESSKTLLKAVATAMAIRKDQLFKKKIKETFGNGIEIDGSFWNINELIEQLIW